MTWKFVIDFKIIFFFLCMCILIHCLCEYKRIRWIVNIWRKNKVIIGKSNTTTIRTIEKKKELYIFHIRVLVCGYIFICTRSDKGKILCSHSVRIFYFSTNGKKYEIKESNWKSSAYIQICFIYDCVCACVYELCSGADGIRICLCV